MINDVSEYIQHVLGATGQSDGGDEPADAHAHHSVYYAELPPIRCETCVRLHSQLLCCGLISTRIRSAEHALEQCASIRHCSSSRCMQCPRALGPSDHVSLDPWNSSSLGTRLHRLCRAPFLCALRRALPFGPVRCNRIRQSYTCSAHSLRHAADRSVCRASRRGVRCGACDSAEGTGSGCGAHRRSARRALQRCGSIHHWLCRGHYSASL